MSSIQTFGSFAANFHPHIHSLITEGVFNPEGEFLPLPVPPTCILADIEERFRHLLLKRLYRAERLSETFMNKLLGWDPSGFSVYANQLVFDHEPDRLERLARYLTRAPIALDAVRTDDDGRVELTTPRQPVTEHSVLQLGPLDWIHAICQQIPDRGQHWTRFYGAYANRIRKALFKDTSQNPSYGSAPQPEPEPASACTRATRASWARLIRKVFQVDPPLCSQCGAEMKILAVITEPAVVDGILSRLETSSAQARPPPSALSLHESVPAL